MREMQKAISNLRILLASINGKEEELEGLTRQFERQLKRAPHSSIHGGHSLDATLGIMSEIQERLDEVKKTRKHLDAIKKRAQDELRALQLTEKIEQAKTELALLRNSRNPSGHNEEGHQEKIKELERFIEEASISAGQAITGELNSPDREKEGL